MNLPLSIIKLAASALKQNRLRTILTTTGIIIGTALVIIVLSVGAGIRSLILNQISSITPEALYIEIQVPTEGSSQGAKDSNTAQSIAQGVEVTTMTVQDLEDLRKLPNVKNGYAISYTQGTFSSRLQTKTSNIFAVSASYQEIENYPLLEGRFFSPTEERNLSQVVVLGSEIKDTLFGEQSAIGQSLKINGQNYTVIGVYAPIGTQFFIDLDQIVFMPIQTVQKKILGIRHVQALSIEMENKNLIYPTISQIENTLRRNHQIKDPKKDDFVVRTPDQAMDIVDTITTGVFVLLLCLAIISLVVGGIGITNVMYVSVAERTKEIGLKKAIGARPAVIRFQFILEAVFITLLGGLIGIISGTLIAYLVSFTANYFNFQWPFVVTLRMLIFSFSVPVITGLIFGYAPAQKAAKLDPIEALRKG